MSNNNQHKPGYKHTPLGWIPEDWSIKEFGRFASVSSAKYVPTLNEEKQCIELEHIDQETGSINGFISSVNQKSTKNVFQKGQVLFGKLRPYLKKYWLADFDGVCSSEVWVLQANSEDCCNEYLFRIVQQHRFIQVANVSSGSKMPRADWHFVAEFPFALPTSPERRKISAILSTWDEAIAKTQQIIVQLQQRNKGLMQQLLTGKKRLKGFEGEEWKKLHATDIFKSVSVKNNGTERLLSATQDRGIIPRDMLEARVTMPTGETGAFKLVEVGDFVISLRSFQGGIEYSEYRGLVSPAYTVLKPTKPINTSFFKHYFKSYDFIGHLAVAVIGIRDGKQVSYEDYSILKLPYPNVEEQEAIATVLDAAVNVVKLYEQKLAALQQQKKGLMQKLLTGEVRVKI